jgi:hypothetical protein
MLSARTYGAITLGLGACAGIAAGQSAVRYPAIPIEYSHLANGLKVVLARDTSTPVVVVAVYYGVGQRTEGHAQEGFAHLFEHLMFEGSTHLGPGALISSNGVTLNGNTRYDFTDYFEIVPPAALQLMLWAEADRMGGLVVDDSALHRQKEIAKSEVRLSYVNRADGGFPWLDVPQAANRNWQNAQARRIGPRRQTSPRRWRGLRCVRSSRRLHAWAWTRPRIPSYWVPSAT